MGAKAIRIKTAEEAEIIRANGLILGRAHAEVAKVLGEGLTTQRLDQIAEEFIRDQGGEPSFKGYNGFPASLCISINEVVVHGLPGERVIKDGDVVSIDCGVYKNGFHADSAYTYAVGEVSEGIKNLLEVTRQSLTKGLEQIRPGNRIGDVAYAIQSFNEGYGYGIVRELVGHGVGKHLHEAPEVPNFGKRGHGPQLVKGMVLAVEPMVTLGKRFVLQEKDGWTVRTEDRQCAAHFEHTVLVTAGGCDKLTTFQYIEEVLRERKMFLV